MNSSSRFSVKHYFYFFIEFTGGPASYVCLLVSALRSLKHKRRSFKFSYCSCMESACCLCSYNKPINLVNPDPFFTHLFLCALLSQNLNKLMGRGVKINWQKNL